MKRKRWMEDGGKEGKKKLGKVRESKGVGAAFLVVSWERQSIGRENDVLFSPSPSIPSQLTGEFFFFHPRLVVSRLPLTQEVGRKRLVILTNEAGKRFKESKVFSQPYFLLVFSFQL